MANPYGVPVRFTKEKNVWDIFGIFNIGSSGALNVATVQTGAGPQFINKGIANVWSNTPTFTGFTSSGSATITSVSSFAGIYTGMTMTNPSGVQIVTSRTVGTISAATGSLVLSAPVDAATTGSTTLLVASGGQYIFQFGVNTSTGSLSQFSRLDTYNRLLNIDITFDGSTASSIGTQTQAPIAPNVTDFFVVQNNLTTKTVPATLTSNSTDASLVIQFGNGLGTSFIPAFLQAGTAMRMGFTFGNTTAP